jgi:DNA-binding transcriptional MocR family regulator
MRRDATWRPRLGAGGEPIYKRLANALRADIARGRLAPGDRLPTQRDLAHALSISVGAVTRAYDETARLGLIEAQVGRGSFVARPNAASIADGVIDLSVNLSPTGPAQAAFAETLAASGRARLLSSGLEYAPPCGPEAGRRAGAAWLSRCATINVDWRRTVCCAGAQSAIAIAGLALGAPGDALLCESAAFSGVRSAAEALRLKLYGVEMDGDGLKPDALARAARDCGARLLYTVPTLQNPTARTMSAERRNDIAKVARKHDLWIIEDDIYAYYARSLRVPPIAALAPERTIYVSSLSKIVAPGLRAGFLVAPTDEIFDRVARAAGAMNPSSSGLGSALATEWIESGRADDIAESVFADVAARTGTAAGALKGAMERLRTSASPHVFLPLSPADAEAVARRALRLGLRVTPPDANAVSIDPMSSGLRLSIGSAPDLRTLDRALTILSAALAGESEDRQRIVL